jgi:3-oxoacyl-[acyl-carrier-protein] synthase-3
MQDLGVDPERAILSHSKYGNTATASVGLAFDHLLQEREVNPGDKLLLASAAAGFTYVAIMAEWT